MKALMNQKLLLALGAITLLGLGGAGLYRLGAQQAMKSSVLVAGDAPATAGDKKPLYWHDPMVPGQKFDKPGKSPFMDMQLVPVYGGEAGDEGKVSISPRVQQNLGVRTAVVTRGKLAASLTAVGSVAYNERELALVQARANGFIEKMHVRAPLDPVKKGQPLLELYVPDWIAAQEEYLTAKRLQGQGMDAIVGGARQRMRLAGMPENQIRLVESSGRVHPRIMLFAPVSGVVTELAAREGMTVMAGAPLYRINGLATVWINAEVPESLAALVRPGNTVEARTPALSGIVFKGKVSTILPEVNPATRTLKARIELANPGGQLVPGMFATLSFAAASGKDVLLVPTEAIIQTGTRSVVMVAQGEGKFLPMDVETGMETNGQTEIRKGLEAGQKVVVSGQFLLDSEASLKGTATRMGEAQQPANDIKAAGQAHRGNGRVEKIGKDEITLSHGPIASLNWGAMTMGFKLPAGGLPRNVAVGDTVIFEIRQTADGMYQVSAISPTADAPPSTPMKAMPPTPKTDKPGAQR
jgi:Cu(I)/Ag(I) efflux system membrane fusion protein